MGAVSFGIRVIAPADSRRGKKVRGLTARIRNRRAYNFAKGRYNKNRQNYYDHAVTKRAASQDTKISIVVPCYNTPKKYFEPLLASVFSQGYENWELVLIDASDSQKQARYLEDRAQADTRIAYLKVSNEGIASNTNKGINAATGELLAFLDHDDTLDQDALFEAARMFRTDSSLGLVYSDEDKLDETGETYFEPHFKPDLSLDMLRNLNYITHFVVVKKSIAKELGGIRKGFEGAQDYDFLLRVVDSGASIGHIPKILYHWRQAEGSTAADFSNKQHVTDAGCQALRDHYTRRRIKNVSVHAIKNRPGFYRTNYKLDNAKKHIFVDLSDTTLTTLEKEFILESYRKNKDAIKYKVTVSDKPAEDKNTPQLIVKGPFIPAHTDTDMAALFGLSTEDGVSGVAPKIVKDGRVFDAGIVKVGRDRKYLFRGVNPLRPVGFGSVEWVRNVDELTGNVAIRNQKAAAGNKRWVVWPHSEFIALSPVIEKNGDRTRFYNPNLSEYSEIVENPEDYIADQIEIKK